MILAIYTQEKSNSTELISFINQYEQTELTTNTIDHYFNLDSLLSTHKIYDLIFVDIGIDSFRTISYIKEYLSHHDTPIVFICEDDSYALEAHKVGVLNYLVTPLTFNDINITLNRCCKLQHIFHDDAKNLFIKGANESHVLPINMIQFLEVRNKTCLIHMSHNHYQAHSSLEQLLEKIDSSYFLRIHRSYAVNLNHVENFVNYKVFLKGNYSLPASRQNYGELKKQFHNFLERND